MGGDHEVKFPKVPDWRIYKVEDVPQLMNVQKALASHNLKDPWLRNYVWLYTEYINNKNNPSPVYGLLKGWKQGFVAAVISTLLFKAYVNYTKPDDIHIQH